MKTLLSFPTIVPTYKYEVKKSYSEIAAGTDLKNLFGKGYLLILGLKTGASMAMPCWLVLPVKSSLVLKATYIGTV